MNNYDRVLILGTGRFIGDCLARGITDSGGFVYGMSKIEKGCKDFQFLTDLISDYHLQHIFFVDYEDEEESNQFSNNDIQKLAEQTGLSYTIIDTISTVL